MNKHRDGICTCIVTFLIGVIMGCTYFGIREWKNNETSRLQITIIYIAVAIVIIALIEIGQANKRKVKKIMLENDWKDKIEERLNHVVDSTDETVKLLEKLNDSIDNITDRMDNSNHFKNDDISNCTRNLTEISDENDLPSDLANSIKHFQAKFILSFCHQWNRHVPIKEQDLYIETEDAIYYWNIRWHIELDHISKKPQKIWQVTRNKDQSLIASASCISDLGIATAYAIATIDETTTYVNICSHPAGYFKNPLG